MTADLTFSAEPQRETHQWAERGRMHDMLLNSSCLPRRALENNLPYAVAEFQFSGP